MSLEQTLSRLGEEIDSELQSFIASNAPFVADMAGYFFGWLDQNLNPEQEPKKGKRLRPIMSLLICQALSGDYKQAMPLAVAIELTHNYSLIHDDIADRDEERRGRPTVWKIWGDGLAINTGSILYTLAYKAITELKTSPEIILQLHDMFVKTSLRLSEGQHWDINYERDLEVDQDMYLRMIEGKTAALLEFSAGGGALLGSGDIAWVNDYKKFGLHLGLAFQIRDDYLSIWGDTKETGKPPFSDLRNKKKSLPITYAFDKLQGAALDRFATIYADIDNDMTDSEIEETLVLLETIDARTYTSNLAEYHTQQALEWLDKPGVQNPSQDILRTLAMSLLGRAF